MKDNADPSGVFNGVDADLLARAAALAASRGSTLAEVLTSILSEYLSPTDSSPMSDASPSIEHTFESPEGIEDS